MAYSTPINPDPPAHNPAWFCEGPNETYQVFFAPQAEVAAKLFAARYTCDLRDVEVTRAEAFDRFFPGPVTNRNYVEVGWVIDCYHPSCLHMVGQDGCDADEGEPHEGPPIIDDDEVYCSAACRDADHLRRSAEKARRDEATRAAVAAAQDQWPGIKVVRTLAVRVENPGAVDEWIGAVYFRFPGATADVSWIHGDERVFLGSAADVVPWEAFTKRVGSGR